MRSTSGISSNSEVVKSEAHRKSRGFPVIKLILCVVLLKTDLIIGLSQNSPANMSDK